MRWKQLSCRLLFTVKPFGDSEGRDAISLSLSVDSADRVRRGEVSEDTSCCEPQSDAVSQATEVITFSSSGFKQLKCLGLGYILQRRCDLSLNTFSSHYFSSFPVHLVSIQDASVFSHPDILKLFCVLKMALNYAVMTGGMEVDGLSVSWPDHTDSDFVTGGQRVAVMTLATGPT